MLQLAFLFLITLCTMVAFSSIIIYVRSRPSKKPGPSEEGCHSQNGGSCCSCSSNGLRASSSQLPMYRE